MRLWKPAIAITVLCGLAIPGIAGQIGRPPAKAPAHAQSGTHNRTDADACPKLPSGYGAPRGNFTAFSDSVPLLDATSFKALAHTNFGKFGRTFGHRVPARQLADQLAIYGYDYIGNYREYMLFYRRPEGWWTASSLPPLFAPNGERLPDVQMPTDLNPEWPAPALVAGRAPFRGAIVLPQQIIAIPCWAR